MIECKAELVKRGEPASIAGYVKFSGDRNDICNEARGLLIALDKNLGAETFAMVLDDWLKYDKGFKMDGEI